MYKLGIDVGGTNTDAVLIDEKLNVVASVKQHTTSNIYDGISMPFVLFLRNPESTAVKSDRQCWAPRSVQTQLWRERIWLRSESCALVPPPLAAFL